MAHKLISEEMVEKAINAQFCDESDDEANAMRAALEAVADDLIEAIALVAEEEADQFRAVQAIRSLKSQGQ